MYFVVAGQMVYHHGKSLATEVGKLQPSHTCLAQESLCEQVLMFKWMHRGLLIARMLCEFVQLDAAMFREIVKAHADTKELFKRFCSVYAEILLQNRGSGLTDMNLGNEVICGLIRQALDKGGFAAHADESDGGTFSW